MKTLIFVYNGNAGLFNMMSDYAHKIISPETYECNLCALTYGNLGMKQKWKKFISTLEYEVRFLHKDEFEKEYDIQTSLPSVFYEEKNNLKEVITSSELNDVKSLDDLIVLVKSIKPT